ncbi:hypothetical protein Taro_056040 [Colocasia esculenta]|uniref:Uncharacterized protein n=1 Tax=Colocasia esculenta TaxID=4460 RepID=A0A843XVE6_COLES|nr:hypothetical protein [Colocasia esculenta]
MHGRAPHRLVVFKMGRCKDLPDDTESWVDEESRRRYEAMNEMITPSDVDAKSHTTATPEEAFISVMGKDRPGRVRCAGSGETLSTWYGSTRPSAYSERERKLQEQLKVQKKVESTGREDESNGRKDFSIRECIFEGGRDELTPLPDTGVTDTYPACTSSGSERER